MRPIGPAVPYSGPLKPEQKVGRQRSRLERWLGVSQRSLLRNAFRPTLAFCATVSLPLSRSRPRASDCGECRNMSPGEVQHTEEGQDGYALNARGHLDV